MDSIALEALALMMRSAETDRVMIEYWAQDFDGMEDQRIHICRDGGSLTRTWDPASRFFTFTLRDQ